MLFEVKEGIWFDNLSAAIHKGTPGARSLTGVSSSEEMAQRRGPGWRPTLIYLSATDCNLRCKYCYADCGTYGMKSSNKVFSFEDYVESYERMRDIFGGVSTLSFFGGEPLLGFAEIRRFVEYLHERYPREELPELSINTNSTIAGGAVLDFLRKYDFIIGTSIDGPRDVHDENRIDAAGGGTYDRVLRNIDRFTDRDIHVFVQYTFNKSHLDRYEPGKGMAAQWYRELESLPIENYDMIPVSSEDPRFKLDMHDEESLARYLAFCEESADYYLDRMRDGDISKLPRMFVGLMLRIMTRTLHKDCSAGYSLSITPDRQVFPCHAFASDERFAVSLDELRGEADLLANPWFRSVREADRLKVEKCEKCIARRVCGVWCKALTFGEKGSFDDVLEERCVLMDVYTRRIVRFLVEEYPAHREAIRDKLLAYNRVQMQMRTAYES
ncbi:hypothetical protein CDO73_01390 [Saccharibacillus sp. O23]|uniref:radical SAM/SPASM domain-containing protein n=1 Tax=Saccharibacillus sp. O23 TaxID=2009338 RepID=UPI000B4E6769|nr:radical SAM protein [Saccharibacillus sp. O23]OWR33187.1 hypothetical protein CDO73_01390 [Saccharibacillus sp. O23]